MTVVTSVDETGNVTGGELAGRRILITGAAGGLGSACARMALDAEAHIVVSDLPGDDLSRIGDELSAAAGEGRVSVVPGDLSTPAGAKSIVNDALSGDRDLDGLVACAGIMQTKPFAAVTQDEWRRVLDVNLTAAFTIVQRAADAMSDGVGGSIVLVSSVAGRRGRALAPHYAASKAGVLSLTQSAALAFAPDVRVNAVCPGVFPTRMWDGIIVARGQLYGDSAGGDFLDEVVNAVPLARAGEPPELAQVVTFLLSRRASYVTGQAVNVDGGLEMH